MEDIQTITKTIQLMQNEYMKYKKMNEPLEMLCVMWDIGDYLVKIGIRNPHALGWKIQAQKAYVKRPIIFRSFVIRRIWNSKTMMKNDLYGVKSVNSVIELFPFLDQNSKWKLPQEKKVWLLEVLNKRSAKELNRALLKIKMEYIGIKNVRTKHLSELKDIKEQFYLLFNKLRDLLEGGTLEDCEKFRNSIGIKNLINLGSLCFFIGAEKDFDTSNLKFFKSDDDSFYKFALDLSNTCNSRVRQKRIRRVIDSLDLINMTDFCNSIITKEGTESFRKRANTNVQLG